MEVHRTQRTDFTPTRIGASVLLALSGITSPALAQQAGAPAATAAPSVQTDRLESIVVTANKRVEKLESVPMAISVINEETIQRNNIREIEDVVALTPALSVNAGTTSANNAIAMRGVGTQTTSIALEPDVIS